MPEDVQSQPDVSASAPSDPLALARQAAIETRLDALQKNFEVYQYSKIALMSDHANSVLEPQHLPARPEDKNLTIVLDLDETLVHAETEEDIIAVRPGTRKFLQDLRERFPNAEIFVWTAAKKTHADRVMNLLDPESKLVDAVISKGQWYPRKDLCLLRGRPPWSVKLVDDNEVHAMVNPEGVYKVAAFNSFDAEFKDDKELDSVLEQLSEHNKILAQRSKDGAEDRRWQPKFWDFLWHREHPKFLKFFNDALDADPNLAYAISADCLMHSKVTGQILAYSPLYILSTSLEGIAFINRLFAANPAMRQQITWRSLSITITTGNDFYTSAFYRLCKSEAGIKLLMDIFAANPAMLTQITALDLVRSALYAPDTGMSPMYHLSTTPLGLECLQRIFAANPALMRDITSDCLARTVRFGASRGASIFSNLIQTDTGIALLNRIFDEQPNVLTGLPANLLISHPSILPLLCRSNQGIALFLKLFSSNPGLLKSVSIAHFLEKSTLLEGYSPLEDLITKTQSDADIDRDRALELVALMINIKQDEKFTELVNDLTTACIFSSTVSYQEEEEIEAEAAVVEAVEGDKRAAKRLIDASNDGLDDGAKVIKDFGSSLALGPDFALGSRRRAAGTIDAESGVRDAVAKRRRLALG